MAEEQKKTIWQVTNILGALFVLLLAIAYCNPPTSPLKQDDTPNIVDEFEGAAAIPAGAEGSLLVTVKTTGAPADIDANGYWVEVSADEAKHVDAGENEVARFVLDSGEYRPRLTGVAANCSVTYPVEEAVAVGAADDPQASMDINVHCEPALGGVTVHAKTQSGEPPGGFSATVNGERRVLAPNGSTVFSNLAVGNATVSVSDFSPCRVVGAIEREVEVEHGLATQIEFAFDCSTSAIDIDGFVYLLTTTNTRITPREGTQDFVCDLQVNEDTITIVSTGGNSVQVTGLEGEADPWTGTLEGNTLTFSGTRPEDDGITAATYTLLVSNDGNDVEGQEEWTWDDEDRGIGCFEGESTVTGFRIEN